MGDLSSDAGDLSCLANRLTAACHAGDLAAVQAAVADGASIHCLGGQGRTDQFHHYTWLPLAAALSGRSVAVVVWLLAHGACVDDEDALAYGLVSTPYLLQLLIDVGGTIDRLVVDSEPLLFSAINLFVDDDPASIWPLAVLLAQPSLDLDCTSWSRTPAEYASTKPLAQSMITSEVTRRRALSPAQADREYDLWALEGVGRLMEAGLGSLRTPIQQRLLSGLRFAWINAALSTRGNASP